MVAPGGGPDPQQPQLSGEAPAEGAEAPAASAAPPVAPGGTLAAAMASASAASHGGGPPARSQDPSRTVFVGGLPPEATEPVLRVFFQPFGTLTSVRVRARGVARPAPAGLVPRLRAAARCARLLARFPRAFGVRRP